jgi:hypothetical protein
MRQRTLGLIAVGLLVGGVALGAATAFAAYRSAGSPTANLPQPPQLSRHHQWPFGPPGPPRTGLQRPGLPGSRGPAPGL